MPSGYFIIGSVWIPVYLVACYRLSVSSIYRLSFLRGIVGCYFLSRPRRFGKSLLISTLESLVAKKHAPIARRALVNRRLT
ncbi:MAG: hypothetical protein COA42_14180 [Alteromonadaceae bacterium]|nr:MAG: hypothetical protein COA42_14180 [Alteromonadaceae bacterium]